MRVYLERRQKQALQAKAKATGTTLAEQVRRAVDAHLAGISAEDLRILDEGSRRIDEYLGEMIIELDRVNSNLDAAFVQLSHRHPA